MVYRVRIFLLIVLAATPLHLGNPTALAEQSEDARRPIVADSFDLGTILLKPNQVDVPPGAGRSMSPVARAIFEANTSAIFQMESLIRSIAVLEEGPAREALQKKAVALKRQHRLQILEIKADFARQRGDLEELRLAEFLISRMKTPTKFNGGLISRPAPAKRAYDGGVNHVD